MATLNQLQETMQFTLTLPADVAQHVREQVATGLYANESEYLESLLLSDTIFDFLPENELVAWINTEGVRRLRAMEADPSSALSTDEVFGFDENANENEAD